jgi:ABC-type iron transport system FetAB ATPase subunit
MQFKTRVQKIIYQWMIEEKITLFWIGEKRVEEDMLN